MTLPTTADFNNAKRDLDDLAEIVTSPTVKDVPKRLGGNTPTLSKVMSETTDFLATQTQRLADRDAEIDQTLVRLRDHAPVRNRGAWITGTTYEVNDIWQAASDVWYVVVEEYVAGATDVADIASGKVFVHQVNIATDTVASIADLRLFEPSSEGQRVVVSSYYPGWAATVRGAFGGGEFYSKLNDTGTGNDGTLIKTSAENSWNRVVNGKFLAEWFGVDKSNNDNYEQIMSAYDAAESAGYDALWLPSSGGVLWISDTIKLKRGVALMGGSTIDDQHGTVLKKANDTGVPMIATPAWFNNDGTGGTHYFVVKGITLDGNRDNQTVRAEAIALWNVFVGTELDNIFVLNNLGPGITNEYAYDYKIGLMWINTCTVGSGAAFEIDQQQTSLGGGAIGLIDIESLYIENPAIETDGGPLRTTPSNRGVGIKAGQVGRLNITNLHQEACDANIHITHGQNDIVKIGVHSSAWTGSDSGLNANIYLESSVKTLDVGPSKVYEKNAGLLWLKLGASLKTSNIYPEITATKSWWGGCSINTQESDPRYETGFRTMSTTDQRLINNESSVARKMHVSETNDDSYYYEKSQGAYNSYGSKVNQVSEKDFCRLESYGNSGDRITDFVPRVLVAQDSPTVSNALVVTSSNELRIKINGVTYDIQMAAV